MAQSHPLVPLTRRRRRNGGGGVRSGIPLAAIRTSRPAHCRPRARRAEPRPAPASLDAREAPVDPAAPGSCRRASAGASAPVCALTLSAPVAPEIVVHRRVRGHRIRVLTLNVYAPAGRVSIPSAPVGSYQ
jgi:hypothetical protein